MLTPVGEVPVQLIGGRVIGGRAALKTSASRLKPDSFPGGGRQALPLIRGGRVEIGEPRRVYTIEPLEDPVPREEPEERPVEQPAEPLEPELPRR